MKRIIVIGSGGAGKSTFAKRLHEITGIKLIHLDKLYWQPNWGEPSKDVWRIKVKTLLKEDSWIMDGNYGGTLEMRIAACDTIIFLDLPRIVCIWRVFKRVALYRNKVRPDMAEDCLEKFDLKFLKWIWDYPTRTKPGVEEKLKRSAEEKTIIRLASKKEINKFFVNLKPDKVKSV